MKTTFILLAAILLSGCSHCDDCGSLRSKIPAQSVSGEYYAAYALYIDGVESLSSKESWLRISSDGKSNTVNFITFRTHSYTGLSNTHEYKVIPEPGMLWEIGLALIPVEGIPYDVNFEGVFMSEVAFYGSDEATMYDDRKVFERIEVSLKGWMKENAYYHNSGYASYDCEITMDFTVEDVEYRIVITETRHVFGASYGWFD